MRYVNETGETLELEWQTEHPAVVDDGDPDDLHRLLPRYGRWRDADVTLEPGGWFEQVDNRYPSTHLVIRKLERSDEG